MRHSWAARPWILNNRAVLQASTYRRCYVAARDRLWTQGEEPGDDRDSPGRSSPIHGFAVRQLTFINATTASFEEAILRSEGFSINKQKRLAFWSAVLTSAPSDAFKPLQSTSIRFWVNAFNTWAFERKNKGRIMGHDVSGVEVQHILKLDRGAATALLLAMNPQLEKPHGQSQHWLEGSTANFLQIAAVGVVVSRAVNAQHKFRFAFSLFDFNGSEGLTADQFAMAFRTLYCGFCNAFSVPEEGANIPAKGTAGWAGGVFHRIGKAVGF